jgi:hypothetical protein
MNTEQTTSNGYVFNDPRINAGHLREEPGDQTIEEEKGGTQVTVKANAEEGVVQNEQIEKELELPKKEETIVEEESQIKKFIMNDLKDMKKCLYSNQKNQKKIINKL